jgi:hypothetical protein
MSCSDTHNEDRIDEPLAGDLNSSFFAAAAICFQHNQRRTTPVSSLLTVCTKKIEMCLMIVHYTKNFLSDDLKHCKTSPWANYNLLD